MRGDCIILLPKSSTGTLFHGAQLAVGNREGLHYNKEACGKREEKNHHEYEKLLSLLCFVDELPKLNGESTRNILLHKAV